MDRQKYILKRFENILLSFGYKDPFLYRDGDNFIAAIFQMNEETENFYAVQLGWCIDTETEKIIFRAERVWDTIADENEEAFLHFCNSWNNKSFYGTALYNKELYLDHTLPLPDRISDMYLIIHVYRKLAFAAERFFEEAQKEFNWIPKPDVNL